MSDLPAITPVEEQIARALCTQKRDDPGHWAAYVPKAKTILAELSALREEQGDQVGQDEDTICGETDEYVDVCVGVSGWQAADDRWFVEDDYRVDGEIWRVHKGDADPYPSRPHAHCVGGAKRFIGCKLHLGTAELYEGRRALGRFLVRKQFERLIELIRPKFPGLELPLPLA